MFRLFNQACSDCTTIIDKCHVLYNSTIQTTVGLDLQLVTIGDHVLSQEPDDKMCVEI